MALLVWFAWGSLAIGAAGSMALRFITRPLADVVKQAQALEARQFLHIAEPKTPELRTVVRAMNNMVDRLKAMFNEESDRLNVLRLKINNDALTGLASREYFLSLLNELLTDENSPPNGTLVILRLKDIRTLNTQLGHHQVDQMLIALAELLKIFCRENRYSRAGRLKGNEFALVCPGLDTPKQIAGELHQQLLTQWSPKWINDVHDLFHLGAVAYQRQQAIGELLSHADDALARAELVGENSWYSSDDGHAHPIYTAGKWLSLLKNAISEEKLWLDFYPVINCTSRAHMHMEAMVRLQINEEGKSLYAGDFMPMAIQLHLNTLIDIQVIQLALKKLLHSDSVIAINLSSESIANYTFRSQLMNTLEAEPQACQRMLFEVSEFGAFKQFDAFRDLSHKLKQLGCRVGIEYVSQCLGESQKLAELGLDYVKLNPVFLNGIHNNLENQSLLKGMCTLARHFGFVVIALGVTSEKDLTLLAALGFDGATGPGVK
jgi:diguanylate cyclase (GGDEF)-like protein